MNTNTSISFFSLHTLYRFLIGVCIISIVGYLYLVFATTALAAQHKTYERTLSELVTERSDIEYVYHRSTNAWAVDKTTYGLLPADTVTYVTLGDSSSHNVAMVE